MFEGNSHSDFEYQFALEAKYKSCTQIMDMCDEIVNKVLSQQTVIVSVNETARKTFHSTQI